MKRWHSLRSSSSSVWGRTLSRTKKPSSRNLRTCSVVICGAETAIGLFSLVADDHRICGESRDVLTLDRDFLSFLAMLDDLGLRDGVDGRVVRHVAGDVRSRAHRHAEVEVKPRRPRHRVLLAGRASLRA